jgi:hypothetical protein
MQPELKFNFKSIKLNWTIGLKFNGIEFKLNWREMRCKLVEFLKLYDCTSSELIYERHKLESVDNVN